MQNINDHNPLELLTETKNLHYVLINWTWIWESADVKNVFVVRPILNNQKFEWNTVYLLFSFVKACFKAREKTLYFVLLFLFFFFSFFIVAIANLVTDFKCWIKDYVCRDYSYFLDCTWRLQFTLSKLSQDDKMTVKSQWNKTK